jgi:hypothetical protein
MYPAVIGKSSSGSECYREGEPIIVYARIKYSVWIIWRARRHAVIVCDPGPIDDIADADGDRARIEDGPALSHVNIRRRRGSEGWEQDQKQQCQSEIHFESFAAERIWTAG